MQNRRLPPMGPAKPGGTRRLTAMALGLACQESVGWVLGPDWNWTNPSLRFESGLLADYPDNFQTWGKSEVRPAQSGMVIWGSACNCDDEWKTVNIGSMLYSVDAVVSVCYTWCMLYLVYVIHSVCCTWCMRYRLYAVLSISCTWCILYKVYVIVGVWSTLYMLNMESAVFDACQTCFMLCLVHTVYVVCCTRC
jgi:hypothetical protein